MPVPVLYNLRVTTVEIVAIGNEILLGFVQDTNSNYLCQLVRKMGGRVQHVSAVRDDIDAIAVEIDASLKRKARLIFTCGGLGPTEDDLTLAAVAQATARGVERNTTAEQFVKRRYRELAAQGYVSNAEMTESRLKMSRLPKGARPIENAIGAAPAVVLEAGATSIISLPGVPAELKAIVEGPLQDLLAEVFGRRAYREREFIVECGDESQLAPLLREVASLHPEVYIKSRASHFGSDVKFRILVCASGDSDQDAEHFIESVATDLGRSLDQHGIKMM
jgi:nicotinamide-nucleotide amidase